MKKSVIRLLAVLLVMLLTACRGGNLPDEPTETQTLTTTQTETTEATETTETTEATETTETEATENEVTEPEETLPEHSALFLPDVPVEDVITYFNEVCLDSEFVNGGDPSIIQKWSEPIFYMLEGSYTAADLLVLQQFEAWLNTVEGFPGISATEDVGAMNMQIHFGSSQDMVNLLGDNFAYMDGGVTFWYMNNEIYRETICYRSDIDQYLRNSVILEEIYNGLGPVQDTELRPDSIIYQQFSQPQCLTPVDELILRLLYHPEIKPGMNAEQCEAVIRSLYY